MSEWLSDYTERTFIDSKDTTKAWCVGIIQSIDHTSKTLRVRYDGWSSKWDNTFTFSSGLIAPFRKYSELYTGQKNFAIRDWVYSQEELLEVQEQLKSLPTSPFDITQFLRGRLFTIIDCLLVMEYQSVDDLEAVVEFFKGVLGFIVTWISKSYEWIKDYYESLGMEKGFLANENSAMYAAWPEMLLTLKRLFGLDPRTAKQLVTWRLVPEDYEYFPATANKNHTLAFFVNYFASLGGFSAIMDLVKNGKDKGIKDEIVGELAKSGEVREVFKAPLRMISMLPVYEMRSYFSRSFDGKWTAEFKERVMERLDKMDNKELKSVEKDTLSAIMGNMKKMVGNEDNWEIVELNFALRLINCPFMEKKLKGVTEIKEIIESLHESNPKNRNITSEIAAKWIIENKVLENILENTHEEIIKRMANIFVFLSNAGMLKNDHVLLLWANTQARHNSLEQAAYEVILQITQSMHCEIKAQLYQKMTMKNIEDFTEEYIRFLCEFSIKAMDREKKEFYALDFLYELSLSCSSKDLHDMLIGSFISVLKHTRSKEKVDYYMGKSLENLLSSNFICQCIIIILKIMGQVMNTFSSFPHKEELNKRLESETQGLSSVLVKNCAGILSGEVKTAFSSTKSIKVCLRLWKFIIRSRAFDVKIEDIKSLWELTQKNPEKKAHEKFMKTLLKMVKNEFNPGFNLEILQVLFLQNVDLIEIITQDAFEVFYELFLRVNHDRKNLEMNLNGLHSRNSLNLIGQNTLISILFTSTNEAIVSKSMKLLINLNLKINRLLSPKKEEIWADFLTTLKKYIITNKTSEQSNKALRLILQFIGNNIRKEESTPNTNIKFKQVHEQDFHNLPVNDRTTIGVIRKKIGDFYSKPVTSVNLISNNERFDYLTDDLLLTSLRTPWNFLVDFTSHKADSLSPYMFFCKCDDLQECLLGKISELDNENAQLAWMILSKCTVLKRIKEEVQDFLRPFDELFATQSLYKLVYNLNIVEDMIKDDAWLSVFKDNLGVEVLVGVYLDFEIERKYPDSLVLEYYTTILKILSETARLVKELPERIVTKIFDSLVHAAKTCSESEDSAEIARSAREIINLIKSKDPKKYLQTFSSYPLTDLLTGSLLKCSCRFFSSTMSTFFLEHSNIMPELNMVFLKGLLSVFDEAIKENNNESYWGLLSFYIEEAEITEELSEKYRSFVDVLKNHPPENNYGEPDFTLSGILKVLKTVVKKIEIVSTDTVDLVLHICLFEIPSASSKNAPKCKKGSTRKDAFELLKEMCKSDQNALVHVLKYLSAQYKDPSWRTCKSSDWNYHPAASEKSFTGYVGIKNLGCICYMISSLQQLFCIYNFRDFILRLPLKVDGINDDDLLYQFQYMFSALKNSDKQFVNPKGICKAFKDWEGRPVNVAEQMDADEFLNTFMDRLDSQIQILGEGNIIKDLFTGYLATELIGKNDCNHRSEVNEAFITLPVQVKNKKHLNESLQSFIEGELLEGPNAYQCDHCDNKVTALRRVCIKYLPNVLFITLRRFEFNYDSMKRVKLFDFCEFPMDLNMENYTQEGIELKELTKEKEQALSSGKEFNKEIPNKKYPNDYYQYYLRGIIIHSGTADSGHYYSFIRDNNSWYEFNDTLVTTFDPNDIRREAFGGDEKPLSINLSKSTSLTSSNISKPKIRNAYILIYERSQLYTYNKDQENLESWNCRIQSPEQEFLEVKIENERFWRCKSSFSSEYFDFVLQLLTEKNTEISKFGICIFFTVIVRSRDFNRIASCIMCIKEHLHKNEVLSEWLLDLVSHKHIVKELLMDCPIVEKRRVIVGVVHTAFKQVSSEMQAKFFRKIIIYLPLAKPPMSFNFAQYFELIYRCIKHQTELIFFFEVHLRLLEYVSNEPIQVEKEDCCNVQSTESLGYENYQATDDRFELSRSEYGSSIMYILLSIRLCHHVYENYQLDIFFTENVMNFLLSDAESKFGGRAVGILYAQLCSDDKSYTLKYGKYLIACIEKSVFELHKMYMRPLFWLLYNPDKLQPEKIDNLLLYYYQQMSTNFLSFTELESCLRFLIKLVIRIPKVKDWVNKKNKELTSIENKLNNVYMKQQVSAKDSGILKNCLNHIDIIRKLVKNMVNIKNYEDSDNDMIEENVIPGTEIYYFSNEHNDWVKCSVMMNVGELLCIKNEPERLSKWIDSNSEALKKVVPKTN